MFANLSIGLLALLTALSQAPSLVEQGGVVGHPAMPDARESGQLTGAKGPYFGEDPPGTTPKVFAPGIVSLPSTGDFQPTLSPDGTEFYFTRDNAILVSRLGTEGWSDPEPVEFSAGFPANEAHLARDNSRMFWGAARPLPPGETGGGQVAQVVQPDGRTVKAAYGIWASVRTPGGWSPAAFVGDGMFVSSTNAGEIFVTDYTDRPRGYLSRAVMRDGKFVGFERLKGGMEDLAPGLVEKVAHPAISPDGSYVVFDIAGEHLFVCFRNGNGTWGKAVDLTEHGIDPAAGMAYVSPDGKYLFFNWRRDIYWVSTKLIEGLRGPAGAGWR